MPNDASLTDSQFAALAAAAEVSQPVEQSGATAEVTAVDLGGPAAGNFSIASSPELAADLRPRLGAMIGAAQAALDRTFSGAMLDSILGEAFGRSVADTDAFRAAVQQLRESWSQGGLVIAVEVRPAADLQGHPAAYAASNADGAERIYVNAEWLAAVDGAAGAAVLLEEFGHAIDRRINSGIDSPGDEGELFADLVEGLSLDAEAFQRAGGEDDAGMLTIDGAAVAVEFAARNISSVTIPDGVNGYFTVGENVDVSVTFSGSVNVNTSGGTPSLTIRVGSTNRTASYVSGSGSSTLVFRYTIQSGDSDTDGISIASGSISLNSGTIKNGSDNATLTFSAVSANSNAKVFNGSRPTLTTMSTLTGATEDTAFEILYTALTTAGNEANATSFLIDSVTSGTLSKWNGTSWVAVTAGTTTIATGEKLQWTPAANANGTLNAFAVKASNGTLASSSAVQVQVTVSSVNDAPSGAGKTVTINEDSSYTFSASDFGFTDANDSPTNTLLAVKIATLPAAGTLRLSGTTVTAGQSIPAASLGSLVFAPAAGVSSAGYASFTFQVQDNGGTANSGVDLGPSANTITVNVTSVNDTPAGADKTVTINEDSSYTFSAGDFGFTDTNDSPANTLLAVKIATLPAAGTLKLSGANVTAGQSIPVASLGSLVYAPAANGNGAGYASFTFQVQDNGGTSNGGVDLDPSANTVTVGVTAVNDAPVIGNAAVSLLVNAANGSMVYDVSTIGGTASDSDADGQAVAYSLSSDTSNGGFAINAVTGVISVADSTKLTASSYALQVSVTDGLLVGSATITVIRNLYDVAFSNIDLSGLTLLSGTAEAVNAVYRKAGAITIGGQVIDARLTIVGKSNIGSNSSDFLVDDDSSNAGRLQTQLNSTSSGGSYVEYRIAFFLGGTTTPAALSNFFVSAVDVDGLAEGQEEYVELGGFSSFQLGSATQITTSSGGLAGSTRFTGRSDNLAGITFDDTASFMARYENAVSSLDFRLGFTGSTSSARLFSVGFGASPGTFANSLTINDVSVNEAAGTATFTVTRSSSNGTSSVAYATSDGTAVAGSDYTAKSGTVSFASGEASKTITVSITVAITNDSVYEGSQTFNVTLSSPSNATISDAIGVGTIKDDGTGAGGTDDDRPLFSVSDVTVDERAGTATFTVTKTGSTVVSAMVDYATSNGTATAGADYTAASGVLSFAANETTKTITVAIIDDANYEGNETFSVVLSNAINAKHSDANGVGTITENDPIPNRAPAGADKTVTVLEDGSYEFAVSDFGFTDPNDSPANSLLAVKMTTLPAVGTLKLNGVVVVAGDSVAVADLSKLVFTPAANAKGTGYSSFTFQVQDNGGTANGGVDLDASANTITVNVTSVNDAPAGADKTLTIDEDGSYTFAASDFGFSDSNDNPANSLAAVKIATLPGAGALKLDGVAVTAGQAIAVADLGKLVFTPAAHANGSGYATFTFQVQDNGGTTNGGVDLDQSANTITVNVTSVNDAPAGTDKTVTVDEDGSYTFAASDFGFSDSNDRPANSLAAVRISTLPAAGTLKLDGAAVAAGDFVAIADLAKLVFTPAANANGTGYASFTFQVQDDGGTANGGVDLDPSSHAITIDVTSVNDAPAGADKAVTVDEDGSYTFAAADFGFTDANDSPANSLAAVKISTLPSVGTLKLDGVAVAAGDFVAVADLAKLVYAPAANANGTGYVSFTFQVQDDGGSANGGVDLDPSSHTNTIDVTSVNDAPAGTEKTVTIDEDGSYTFSAADFGFTDANDNPANSLAAVKIATLPTAGTLKLDGVAVTAGDSIAVADLAKLVFTPAANANGTGYASFTFQVQDDGGTANGGVDLDPTSHAITIDVTSVNDAPAGTGNTFHVHQNEPMLLTDSDFGFSDVDDNDRLSVIVTTLPTAGKLQVQNGTDVWGDVTASQEITFADIMAGRLRFVPVTGAATTENYSSFTFQVRDDGGTAKGGQDTDQSPNTLTVHLLDYRGPNQAVPVEQTIDEDTTLVLSAANGNAITISFIGDDGVDDDGETIRTTLSVTAGTLTVGSSPAGLSITGNGSTSIVLEGLRSQVNAAIDGLRFDPGANLNSDGPGGTHTFTVLTVETVNVPAPGGFLFDTDTDTVDIVVRSVNDAPAGADKTVTVDEDGSYTFSAADFGFSDASDSPANSLAAVKITTLPGAGTLRLDGVAVAAGDSVAAADLAKLVFTPAANANGTGYASFTFQVQDDGGTANGGVDLDPSANTITIDVTSVNDAPVITSNGGGTTAAVTIPENTTAVTTVVAGDVDAGSTLTYSIVGGADAGKFQIDPVTGVLSFKVAPDYENPADQGGDNVYDVVVQVSDGTLVDTQAIAVTVTDVDEVLDAGPLDMTDATDDGVSQDDEITSTGFPVVFFRGEPGLRITLLGPQGIALTEGVHYSISHDAGTGTYTITLLDADPATPGSQLFGMFPAGVFGNTPANTADGFYTVIAEDLVGNRGTVGRFQIDTEGDGLPTNSEDTASGGTLAGGAPAQQGDANGDGVIDSIQNNVATAPLLDPAAFDAAKAGEVPPTAVFGSVVADDSSSDGRPDADRTQLKDLVVAALTPAAVAAIQATGGEPLTSRIGFTASPKTGEPAFVDADPVRPGVQQRYTINLGGAGVSANRFVKVRDDGTVFDFTADGNVNTFDEGADLIDLDNNGTVDRIIITVTDNGVGDFDSRANVIRDPGALVYDPRPTTDLQVSITDGQATYIPGSQLTYTVTVTNAGPTLVTGAMVDVPLPVGTVHSSWTATIGSAVVASGTGAIRQAVNLASSASAVFTVVVDVSRTATAGVAALASVSAPDGTDELNPDDNAAIDADTVLLPTSIVLGSDVGCKSMSTVRVLDVQTGEIREFTPYESRFIGGIRVATADLTGDSIDEIIVAPGRGRIGEIRVFTQWGYELPQYRTIAFPGFTGGVEVGVGDVTGDGQADIVVSMAGGRSEVRVFQVNPSNLADPVADRPVLAFQPFGSRFAGGASVAVADVGRFENGVTKDVTAGDGRRELVVSSGAGMAATVQVYDLSGSRPRLVDTINPFRGASTVGALTLAVGRFDGDTIDDIIISSGQGGRSALEVYSGRVDDRQDLRLLSLVPFAVTAQRNAAVSAVGIDVDQDGRIDFLAAGQGMGGSAGMLRPISLTGSILSQTAFTQSLPPTPLRVAAVNNRPLPVAVTGRNAWLSSEAGAGSLSAKQAAFAAIGTALRGVNADGWSLADRR